jgi:hypothetical protein
MPIRPDKYSSIDLSNFEPDDVYKQEPASDDFMERRAKLDEAKRMIRLRLDRIKRQVRHMRNVADLHRIEGKLDSIYNEFFGSSETES